MAWRQLSESQRASLRLLTETGRGTEMGDLLPLAKIPYAVGAEAKSDTGEPDAAAAPNHACVQSFTYPFVLEHDTAPAPLPVKPPDYEAIVKRQGFSLRVYYSEEYGWKGWVEYHMFGDDPPVPNNMSPGPFFPWRRLLDARNFERGVPHDIALINWPRQDYAAESPLDRAPLELSRILQRAKQTSQAFLCWLAGLAPELRLRADVMGTVDGMSKYPYIRESRRILARTRVAEQDIVDEYQTGPRARWFAIPNMGRSIVKDMVFHGVEMRAGDMILMPLVLAGRDDQAYKDALAVKFDRKSVRHLAFGAGAHGCPGLHLAHGAGGTRQAESAGRDLSAGCR